MRGGGDGGAGGRTVLTPHAPASDWLLYLIHFFDFAPFFRPSIGIASFHPSFPCRGDGEEVAEVTGTTRTMRVR